MPSHTVALGVGGDGSGGAYAGMVMFAVAVVVGASFVCVME